MEANAATSNQTPSRARFWAEYDHLPMSAMEDAPDYLAALRELAPFGRSEVHGGFYVLTRHADCLAAARDDRFSSAPEKGPGAGFPLDTHALLRIPLIGDDGARHRDFRMQLQKMFTPMAVKAFAGEIRAICDELIDAFIETGEADLSDQYSIEVPAAFIAPLLSLPEGRRRQFQAWASHFVSHSDEESFSNMIAFIDELHDLRCAEPGNDIPSALFDFIIEGRPITRDEWRGLVLLLILGGLDTTANAGGYIFHMIGSDPAIRQYLLEDPARIHDAVIEFIRMIAPVPQHSRGVTTDVEIGGQLFRKGDVVQLNWLAANYDADAFENPEKFDPTRNNAHQLGFGKGPHVCIGRHLAILELEIMIERILARLPDYRIKPDGVRRFASLNRGMSNLKVCFTPGRRITAEAA